MDPMRSISCIPTSHCLSFGLLSPRNLVKTIAQLWFPWNWWLVIKNSSATATVRTEVERETYRHAWPQGQSTCETALALTWNVSTRLTNGTFLISLWTWASQEETWQRFRFGRKHPPRFPVGQSPQFRHQQAPGHSELFWKNRKRRCLRFGCWALESSSKQPNHKRVIIYGIHITFCRF